MPNVTMKEIAKRAGLTQPYVSKILNNKEPNANPKTIEKVFKIVEELNYHPNQYASSLKTGRTNCIGISTLTVGKTVITRFHNPYFGLIYSGIGEAIADRKMKMIFQEVTRNDEYIELAQKRMVDGMIFILYAEVLPEFEQLKQNLLDKMDIPYIVIHSTDQDLGCPSIGIDTTAGGILGTEHLIEHGYKTIGCACQAAPSPIWGGIYNGYRKALAHHKIMYQEKYEYTYQGFDPLRGYELADQLLAEKRDLPRALLVTEDMVALGMMKRFKEEGLRIPEDLAVISFGDELEMQNVIGDLTVIRHPARQKGILAGRLMLDLVAGKKAAEEERHVTLKMALAFRTSCGCPKPEKKSWGSVG